MVQLVSKEKSKRELANISWQKMPNEFPSFHQSGTVSTTLMEINSIYTSLLPSLPGVTALFLSNVDKNDFLNHAKELEKESGSKALQFLFDEMGEYLDNQHYNECNKIIIEFLTKNFTFKLHIGLLTLTNKYKNVLPSRFELYKKAEELALDIYQDKKVAKSVLFGLE